MAEADKVFAFAHGIGGELYAKILEKDPGSLAEAITFTRNQHQLYARRTVLARPNLPAPIPSHGMSHPGPSSLAPGGGCCPPAPHPPRARGPQAQRLVLCLPQREAHVL